MKLGKSEQYIKDGHELDAYMLKVALQDAQLDTGVVGTVLKDEALEELARQYVLAENVMLLCWGLAIGTACALVAVAPAVAERGAATPLTWGAIVLVAAVFLAGLLSSVGATRVELRAPLLGALRTE